ncbi:MAG: hypothetical protein M3220_09460 [Chloroflexota bacterium]|nr:hypothetical protein [Chloroflexota bacterium]
MIRRTRTRVQHSLAIVAVSVGLLLTVVGLLQSEHTVLADGAQLTPTATLGDGPNGGAGDPNNG